MVYPKNFEQKTGFDEIRRMLSSLCLCPLGKELTDNMQFTNNYEALQQAQQLTHEYLRILAGDKAFPCHDFFDLRAALKRIRPEGTFLTTEELFALQRSLNVIREITIFLNPKTDAQATPYPSLQRLSRNIPTFPDIIRNITLILDENGQIKDTASPELARIRHERTAMESSIAKTLSRILTSAQQDGLVEKDASPALRDGRLVIPVAPALKRKIKGIIHDESASGHTVFIEPAEVVEANNRIRELSADEHKEIIRILQTITNEIRPNQPAMLQSYAFLAQIDFIQAKAHLAKQLHAVTTQINPEPLIRWTEARHPLLELSLIKRNKQIVPINIELCTSQRILIISGPNAGGKSVCLKTVGLLQYMLQCGLPIPISEGSHTGIFQNLFIDIGDEQSIEDDLSTYSGRLLNMKIMLKHCNNRSLLLIDEFGGGTEPRIGGAIAEAVLKRFNQKEAYGVITTHYHNIKQFADKNKGIVNAAMLYNRQQMRPLFQLQVGNPGSSFAIEIAQKTGLPNDVINDAAHLVGQEYIDSDKYLQDIARDKHYWENKRHDIHLREKELNAMAIKLETEITQLQSSRKEVMMKAKQDAEELLQASNAKIENTIRAIKEAQAEKQRTKTARQELETFKANIAAIDRTSEEEKTARKMKQIEERKKRYAKRKQKSLQNQKENTPAAHITEQETIKPLAKGDYVRIKGQNTVGKIEELEEPNAIVTFGMMRTNVKIERLQRAEPPQKGEQVNVATFISRQTRETMHQKQLNFKQDLDVRGMRGDEAITAVTYFIDDAILLGIPRVRILHGTGTGILRTLIRQYLGTVSGIKSFNDEHVEFGGAGYTVVDLN